MNEGERYTEAQNLWRAGRLQVAKQYESPHSKPREIGENVTLIVIHNISLPPFEFNGREIEDLFMGRDLSCHKHPFVREINGLEVSSHFVVRRSGYLQQFVSCDRVAYHAGVSSFRGRRACNAFSIGIELEGLDFQPFTIEQYTALEGLIRAIVQHYPIEHICGHEHIAPGRKSDPGPFFDWSFLRAKGFAVADEVAAAKLGV